MNPPRIWRIVAAVAGVGVAVLVLAAHPIAAQGGKPKLRYGITAGSIEGVNPTDVRAATLLWTEGITAVVGLYEGAEATVYAEPAEGARAMNAGQLDLLAISSLEYLAIERNLQATPLLAWDSGSLTVEYVLVARAGAPPLSAAAGRSLALFASNRPWALSEAWTDVLLADAGLAGGQKALSVRVFDKKGRAAMAVFFKQADYAIEDRAAFETAIELNPQLGRELQVMARSPALAPGMVCFSNAATPQVRQQYLRAATSLHEATRFQQTFMTMRLRRLVEWKPTYLDTVRALARARHAALGGETRE